ncbi:MAG: phosphoenolpyruvate synthase [Gemmatimonadaceae bacterium]
MTAPATYVRWFDELGAADVPVVGGKNASLGEMIGALGKEGIRVPPGFATTATAYREFVAANGLTGPLTSLLDDLAQKRKSLEQAGRAIRRLFLRSVFPEPIATAITAAYAELCHRCGMEDADVAVRSSATAEDLPEASFAGQQESFLNVNGAEELMAACRRCYASLFTDRALTYRQLHGFDHLQVALSIGVQKMVRSDTGAAGVMFSIDTETGFPDVVVINAAWGLGESVVKGTVTPDEFVVFKPLLERADLAPIVGKTLGSKEHKLVYAKGGSHATRNVVTLKRERSAFAIDDRDVLQLSRWAVAIERHYRRAMDMEWAKDGETGELFLVQARPETVESQRKHTALRTYSLKEHGKQLVVGLSIGQAIAAGPVQVIRSPHDLSKFREGGILVTEVTDPDWVPLMKRAKGIVTDQGGRTSHAAIVSRELGLPAIVGAGNATEVLRSGQAVTLSCAEGDRGYVYEGALRFEVTEVDVDRVPKTRTRIMMNMASPAAAFRWWRLPADGIGLARIEFIITNTIKVHPMALVRFDELEDREARRQIESLTAGYDDRTEYFVDGLALGIARLAASQYPDPVIVRTSDFKTSEYANLIGGRQFEPHEENPMLGFRGASRYYSERYREGFALECRAIKRVRERMGLTNVVVMIPFCRTTDEADRVLAELAVNGLRRGENGLQVYVMCEIPSNVILASQFARRFDGFSIGSNDLTQLVLGVDRDSADLAYLFDERNEAVKAMIRAVIKDAHRAGATVGICGQAPSQYPEFADFLVSCGIDSISLSPDTVLAARERIAQLESKAGGSDVKVA